MLAHSALSQLTDGPIRSGARAADRIPALMRELGNGAALVVSDDKAGELGMAGLVSDILRLQGIRMLPISTGSEHPLASLLAGLRQLGGGLVVTVGAAPTIELGKAAAAAANNGSLTTHAGGALPRAPLPHIAVPVESWPPAEVSEILELNPHGTPTPASVLRDPRLTPVAVIDSRAYPDDRSIESAAVNRALAVAACSATDRTRSLDNKARALAAAHTLTDLQGDVDALVRRVAISLAGASHPDHVLCQRCAAGDRMPPMKGFLEVADPAVSCLREALARR